MPTLIEFDYWQFSEGESKRDLVIHSAEGLTMPNHRGWHVRPEVHEWFLKNEIDYTFSADWDVHRDVYGFYLTVDNDDDAVLAKLRWYN